MGLVKDKKRQTWRYEFQMNGQRYTGRGYPSRKAAEAARAEKRKEIAKRPTLHGMGFVEAASLYLDYSERKHAKQTYQYKALTYKTFIQQFRGDMPLADIQPAHVLKYLNSLKTNALYNARRKDLSALFAWVIKNYKLHIPNPCTDIEKMPHAPKVRAVPTGDEIARLILAAKPGDEQDIILCCIHLLARIDEILRMKWEDINFQKRVVALWTRKRKDGAYESDSMPINQDLYNILWHRYQRRADNTWVFYNEETKSRYRHRPKMMASLCKRAGVKPIGQGIRTYSRGKNKGKQYKHDLYYGFHSFRHFMASWLADQEKESLKVISTLLRHRNLKTTEIYLHPIDESVREAVTKAEGKFTPQNLSTPQAAPQRKRGISKKSLTP